MRFSRYYMSISVQQISPINLKILWNTLIPNNIYFIQNLKSFLIFPNDIQKIF